MAFDWEESRGDSIGEDGDEEGRAKTPVGKASGALDCTATALDSFCFDDATRLMALLMISMTSSSVSRSSTNILQ